MISPKIRPMQSLNKITLFLLLTSLPLLAQMPTRDRMKTELDSLSTMNERLNRQQQVLSAQADSLAKDIQRRKQQAPSLLQDRGLEAALRFSQTLADSLQKLQVLANRQDNLLRQKAEVLLKILNSDIARLAKQNESLKQQKNSLQQEQVTRELQLCREWQQRCRELLTQPSPAILIYEVQARPDDAPETLRRKADFLRDQADRLRREAKRLDGKITEIRDETQVRQRVAEFANDISLLDPNREGVATSSGEVSDNASLVGGAAVRTDFSQSDNLGNANLAELTLPTSQLWPAQLGRLSGEDLEKWQGKLEQQKKRRQAQADSLMQRATEIESLLKKPRVEKRQ